MIDEDSFNNYQFAEKVFDSIKMGIKIHKVNIQKELQRFNQSVGKLIDNMNRKKDEFICAIAKLEQIYDEMTTKINASEGNKEDSFNKAIEMNAQFCSVNNEISKIKELREKLIKEICEIIRNYSNPQVDVKAKEERKETNKRKFEEIIKTPSPNRTFNEDLKSDKKIIENDSSNFKEKENKNLVTDKDKERERDNYSNSERVNKSINESNVFDDMNKFHHVPEPETDINNILPNINIKYSNQNEIISNINDEKLFINKKRNFGEYKNTKFLLKNLNSSHKEESCAINSTSNKTDKEVIEKLKSLFPSYNIDFETTLKFLKKRLIDSFEFNLLSATSTYNKLKEFNLNLEKNQMQAPVLYHLLHIYTTNQDNCCANSTLFIKIKELFDKRCATFKTTEIVIGGLLNKRKSILNVFEEISKDNFMNSYKINSIKISFYYFLEDVLSEIEKENNKAMIHNIEKKNFTEIKEQQLILRNLRSAYAKIIN